MNILVCVKQVPDTTAVKIDPVTNTLIRDGVPSILNPFDGFALEMALRMMRTGMEEMKMKKMMGTVMRTMTRACLKIHSDSRILCMMHNKSI